jgi:SOS-response transcriptional repressor LexA
LPGDLKLIRNRGNRLSRQRAVSVTSPNFRLDFLRQSHATHITPKCLPSGRFLESFGKVKQITMIVVASTDPVAKLVDDSLHRLGLSYRWIGERIGRNHVVVSSWLRGESRPRDPKVYSRMLEEIKAYEKSQLAIGKPVRIRAAGVIYVPMFSGISAGLPSSSFSDVEEIAIVDNGSGLEKWARVVDGMSMYPLLEPGDIAIFEAREPESYNVVHAFDAGEDTVKVMVRGNKPELRPVNSEYPVLDGRKYSIKGVLIQRIRKGANGETHTSNYPHGMRHVFSPK